MLNLLCERPSRIIWESKTENIHARCLCTLLLLFIDSQMIDMCRTSTTFTDHHGAYLVTPDFPFSYSAGRHCSCTLQAVSGDGQLALEFVHVRLRQHDPTICHDSIDVQVIARVDLSLFFKLLICITAFCSDFVRFFVVFSVYKLIGRETWPVVFHFCCAHLVTTGNDI